MPRNVNRVMAALFLSLLCVFGASSYAAADETASSSNGLKLSPVRTDVTIEPGQTKSVQITVTNVTNVQTSYAIQVNDFTASGDESGQPQILLEDDQFAPSHSLKRLIASAPGVTLQPGEDKVVSIPIAVPLNYKAGGYYGAIRFVPQDGNTEADKNVALSASVGSLVLVTVPGDITRNLQVASLYARHATEQNQADSPRTVLFSNKNVEAVVRFENKGDVQEQPFGKITLKDWRGNVVTSYEINNQEPRGNVLPSSIRKFSVPAEKLGSFGKYRLEGSFGYGEDGRLLTAATSIYVVPVWLVLTVVALIAALVGLIVGVPKAIRAYNKRIVEKARSQK